MNWPWSRKEEAPPAATSAPPSSPQGAAADPAPAAPGDQGPGAAAPTKSPEELLREGVIGAVKKCYDPEIPVNIYDLGLVYGIEVTPEGAVDLKMTLTAPGCPVAGSLPAEVERMVRSVPGVTDAKVELVWDPPWHPGMMSKLARVMLGM